MGLKCLGLPHHHLGRCPKIGGCAIDFYGRFGGASDSKPSKLRPWAFDPKNDDNKPWGQPWGLGISHVQPETPSLLHQGIDLLNGGVLLSSEGQVHHGDIRGGHTWEDTGRSGGEPM